MRIAIVADTFAPLRTSGAVQLGDLARAMVADGHQVTVLVPDPQATSSCRIEDWHGVTVARLRSGQSKGVSYVRRFFAELSMPYRMWRGWRRGPLANSRFDGIVFYSPNIFLTPLVERLARQSDARRYLIIRDHFPEWALDMGILRMGPAYRLLRHIARRQFAASDVIGVQTSGNFAYLEGAPVRTGQRREVLHNWLARRPVGPCSIDVARTPLAGRRIFLYAGNIGIAQGMDIILDVAAKLTDRPDIGFLLVGRGDDFARLAARADAERLDNVLFHGEIDPDEVPGLCAQASVGLVLLDPRHRTHNIPGKFLTYMAAGLPVLAIVNSGNDIVELIHSHGVGVALTDRDSKALTAQIDALATRLAEDPAIAGRCHELSESMFSATAAARQVVAGLTA
jgi:glycosyltransferase involved in cell wall biosynthesis